MVCPPCLIPYVASTAGALFAVKTIDKRMTKKKRGTPKNKRKLKGGRRTHKRYSKTGVQKRKLKGGRRTHKRYSKIGVQKRKLKGGRRTHKRYSKIGGKKRKNILNDYLMNGGGDLNGLLVEHI